MEAQDQAPSRTTIQVDGGVLVAEISGTGDDLLLVHAGIADRRMWDDQIGPFAQRFRSVRHDLRGHGESSPIDAPYSHVDDLRQLVERLRLQRPRVVAASLGARVAVDAVLTVPELFDRMLLVGPGLSGARFEDPSLHECWRLMGEAWDDGDLDRVIELETALWIDGPSRQPGSAGTAMRERVREMQRGIYAKAPEEDPERDVESPATERLQGLRLPILIVVGEHDVRDIHRNARLIEEQAPDARYVVMPGAGHLPNMERPDEFNELALEFLG